MDSFAYGNILRKTKTKNEKKNIILFLFFNALSFFTGISISFSYAVHEEQKQGQRPKKAVVGLTFSVYHAELFTSWRTIPDPLKEAVPIC